MSTQTLVPTPLPDDVLTLLPRLTRSQQAYVVALAKLGTTEAASREVGVDADTVSTWRAPSRDPEQILRRIEKAIDQRRSAVCLALARQHLEHHAVASAERLAARAVSVSESPKQDAIYAHASETLLEAVGVIQRAAQAGIVIGEVRVQVQYVSRPVVGGERAPSVLVEGVPDTQGGHNDQT